MSKHSIFIVIISFITDARVWTEWEDSAGESSKNYCYHKFICTYGYSNVSEENISTEVLAHQFLR